MPAAMLCKIPVICRGETCSSIWKNRTKYACVVDADESLRMRSEGVPPRIRMHCWSWRINENTYGRISSQVSWRSHRCKGNKFTEPLHFGTQIHSDASSIKKIPDTKAAVEKGWEKLEKIPAWQLTEVRNKKEVIEEARNQERKVHFCDIDGSLSS